MKGFGPFLIGAVLGGAGVFASLSYHFVHTKEGVQTIPKLSPTFAETYVDARAFSAADWQQRKALTAAILRANKGAIIGDAAVDQAVQAVQGLLPEVTRAPFDAPQRWTAGLRVSRAHGITASIGRSYRAVKPLAPRADAEEGGLGNSTTGRTAQRPNVEFNRHHYFAAGIVILLLGLQLRSVESYVLNEDATRWLMSKSSDKGVNAAGAAAQLLPAIGPVARKSVVPPMWAGWAALSLGSVLVLHSLALPRPS